METRQTGADSTKAKGLLGEQTKSEKSVFRKQARQQAFFGSPFPAPRYQQKQSIATRPNQRKEGEGSLRSLEILEWIKVREARTE